MGLLSEAVRAVQRNLAALTIYVAISVAATILGTAANDLVMPDPSLDPYEDVFLIAYEFGYLLFLAICAGLAQAIAFARMGKEMDRPLWKISGDREALERYFMMWTGLNAFISVLFELSNWAAKEFESGPVFRFLFVSYAIASIVYIPIGASIMFHGRFNWRRLGEDLAPLFRQIPKTLVLLGLNGLLFILALGLIVQTGEQHWLRPFVAAIAGYFECLVFAAVWLICIHDRQNPTEIDLDF